MPVLVLDVETTGYTNRDFVIELGAVMLTRAGKELGHFGSLVRPGRPLNARMREALAINQIEEKLLVTAPVASSVWEAFLQWASLHAPVEEVLAYNVSFDSRMMKGTFPGAEHLPWGSCIMRDASMVINGDRKGIKLEEAAARLGVELPVGQAHRAVTDAVVAGRIWAAV